MRTPSQKTELLNYAIRARRTLHSMPELSDVEYKTSDYIFAQLTEMGYTPTRIHTGMYVDIKGTSGQKTIALRADFDALPITENTGLAFASTNGCMHACGHDGHTAMCLAVAKALSANAPKSNVRIIFQFGEEGSGGAARMIEGGVLDGVDMIFALHLSPDIPKGKFGTREGALFAGGIEFDVCFHGKSSHVARKSEGINAIDAALEYMNIMGEDLRMYGEMICYQVGKIVAGDARNIVAKYARLESTLRYYDAHIADNIMKHIKNIAAEIDEKYGTTSEVIIHAHYPPLINSADAVNVFKQNADVVDAKAGFTAEDFAMYLEKVNGCMSWLGIRDKSHNYPLHSDKFDFDEQVMLDGIEALLNLTDY